ncbi:hypothetical protein C7S18_17285 [Ahniella affigens]|uniref:Uncharacterized protein n=2 Tax=Ahniella affigens TaxID=2021234 RepID=A0A2P1PVE3_9GAMM|nr:hypothetical protein C7S18_17285 [Ahniella affigens]
MVLSLFIYAASCVSLLAGIGPVLAIQWLVERDAVATLWARTPAYSAMALRWLPYGRWILVAMLGVSLLAAFALFRRVPDRASRAYWLAQLANANFLVVLNVIAMLSLGILILPRIANMP